LQPAADALVTLIAHLSDLHLSPVPFPLEWPWRLKPALGWINWRRQPGAHDNAIWEKTAAAVLAAAPDHIAVTGDLIELGLSVEYAKARTALTRLGDPAKVSWAPGNHDAYTTDTPPRIRAALGEWLSLPIGEGDLRTHFPRLDLIGRAAVITLCSGMPTWTFSAEGALGDEQLARLDAMLAGVDRAQHLPVIAIHHPPVAEGLSPLKRLRDGAALLKILAGHRCPLVLHGHLHEARRHEWVGQDHRIALIGAPSASATGRHGEEGPAFNLVTVAPDLSWSVETRSPA
jgi:3',5'-cyclic AMP phosphodiesterase CpdA